MTEQETRLKEQIAILEKQAQELKMEGSGETAKAICDTHQLYSSHDSDRWQR